MDDEQMQVHWDEDDFYLPILTPVKIDLIRHSPIITMNKKLAKKYMAALARVNRLREDVVKAYDEALEAGED